MIFRSNRRIAIFTSVGRCKRTNKAQFTTIEEALKAKKSLRKTMGAKTKPYPCKFCGLWHIGHDRPPARRQQ